VSQTHIQSLKISHFKSIDRLELRDINDFSVFAGANGSGKSNFFDALNFVSHFMRHGITDALRWQGGFDNIHSLQQDGDARRFEFEIECTLPSGVQDNLIDTQYKYQLIINSLESEPEINEQLFINQEAAIIRNESLSIELPKELNPFRGMVEYSGLSAIPKLPLSALLRNIRIYRIDNPFSSPEQAQSNQDASMLKSNGHNLASVLRRLEQDDHLRETILEWMETVVPSIQQIKTERQKLAINTTISFKEQGTEFPAYLMSDGTIYALSLLVAVLDTPKYGLTLIEEPERGLHPQAIFELIDLIREKTSYSNPIWMTTHSESVVRQLKLNELWLVDKKNGKTQMKSAASGRLQQLDIAPLGIDEAWLSNLLGGGLPW
jgi:predicted ATPase